MILILVMPAMVGAVDNKAALFVWERMVVLPEELYYKM